MRPDIRLTATGADVIKDYVQLGLGIGIVTEMAIADPPRDGLAPLPGSQRLLGVNTTKVAIARGALLRDFAYRFIEILAPHLDAETLQGRSRRAYSSARPHAILPFNAWRELHAPRPLALVPSADAA